MGGPKGGDGCAMGQCQGRLVKSRRVQLNPRPQVVMGVNGGDHRSGCGRLSSGIGLSPFPRHSCLWALGNNVAFCLDYRSPTQYSSGLRQPAPICTTVRLVLPDMRVRCLCAVLGSCLGLVAGPLRGQLPGPGPGRVLMGTCLGLSTRASSCKFGLTPSTAPPTERRARRTSEGGRSGDGHAHNTKVVGHLLHIGPVLAVESPAFLLGRWHVELLQLLLQASRPGAHFFDQA